MRPLRDIGVRFKEQYEIGLNRLSSKRIYEEKRRRYAEIEYAIRQEAIQKGQGESSQEYFSRVDLLNDAMATLDRYDTELVKLRFHENRTEEEIAKLHKTTQATISRRIKKLLDKIRKNWGKI